MTLDHQPNRDDIGVVRCNRSVADVQRLKDDVGTDVERANCLPTDEFCKPVSLSTFERCQRDGSDAADVNAGHEEPQRHCRRFVTNAFRQTFVVNVREVKYCIH